MLKRGETKTQGLASKAYLEKLVVVYSPLDVQTVKTKKKKAKKGKYGRYLATLFPKGYPLSLNKLMVEAGHAAWWED